MQYIMEVVSLTKEEMYKARKREARKNYLANEDNRKKNNEKNMKHYNEHKETINAKRREQYAIKQKQKHELIEIDIVSGNLVDKIMVHLDRKDLISLVKGTEPFYSVFEHPLVKDNGDYVGGFVDKWAWNHPKLNTLSNEELVELYYICKNSW